MSFVNVGSEEGKNKPDTHLYEAVLSVSGLETIPFVLDALPDSFRYDRNVAAIGVNGGVRLENGEFTTTDFVVADKKRPSFWTVA
ncbi:MAG TPA: hypothetical protein VHU90_05740, partial [Galbitalea sp.]|nr:hypothetical protein [Galbitalea sp.]